MARSTLGSRLFVVSLLLSVTALLVVLSASASVPLPEYSRPFSAAPQLWLLNQQVHQRVLLAWKNDQNVSSTDAVLALLQQCKSLLGVEPQLAVIRLPGEIERRTVMVWDGRFYDPILDQSYSRTELATVVRTLSYHSALSFSHAGELR